MSLAYQAWHPPSCTFLPRSLTSRVSGSGSRDSLCPCCAPNASCMKSFQTTRAWRKDRARKANAACLGCRAAPQGRLQTSTWFWCPIWVKSRNLFRRQSWRCLVWSTSIACIASVTTITIVPTIVSTIVSIIAIIAAIIAIIAIIAISIGHVTLEHCCIDVLGCMDACGHEREDGEGTLQAVEASELHLRDVMSCFGSLGNCIWDGLGTRTIHISWLIREKWRIKDSGIWIWDIYPYPYRGGGRGDKTNLSNSTFLLGSPGIVIQPLKWISKVFKVTFLNKPWALVRK